MSRPLGFVTVLLLLASCGEAPIADADLHIRITTPVSSVELGASFPLEVVRSWRTDLAPSPWDDGMLAPLVVRLESRTVRDEGGHREEILRYRAYAFTLQDVTLAPLPLVGRPTDGGERRFVLSDPLHLRVRPALDEKSPGEPELPGPLLAEPSPHLPTWAIPLLTVLVLLGGGLWLRGRARTRATTLPAEDTAAERVLERLRRIRARGACDGAARGKDVTEVAAVLRAYLAETASLPAPFLTAEEVLAAASRRGVGERARDALARVLATSVLVKFAAHRATAEERAGALDDAEHVVQELGGQPS